MDFLITEVLQGKKGAATFFYKTFAPRLRRYLVGKLPDGETEEVLQDVFLAAFDCLSLYRGEAGVYTWLVSIARHEVADFYRKKYVRQIVEKTSPLFENLVSETMSPEFVYEKKKLEQRFGEVYKKLSSEYQDVLCYRYELSMSVKEISERMELSFKAAESLLFRARSAFKAEYERA